MVVKVTDLLLDIDGEAVNRPDNKTGKMVASTIRWALRHALLTELRDENLSGEEKMKNWDLARKITTFDEVPLSIEEAARIKTRALKLFDAGVAGPIRDLLEKANT